MKQIYICMLLIAVKIHFLEENDKEILDMRLISIIANGIPLDDTTNTVKVECLYEPASIGNRSYCRGLCEGQGHGEGQACALARVNVDTKETSSMEYDCDLGDSLEDYAAALGIFGGEWQLSSMH